MFEYFLNELDARRQQQESTKPLMRNAVIAIGKRLLDNAVSQCQSTVLCSITAREILAGNNDKAVLKPGDLRP